MESPRKILILGATGAMGKYLTPLLAERGHRIDAVCHEEPPPDSPGIRYTQANALDPEVMRGLLKGRYDGIVDFLIYGSDKLPCFLPMLLDNAGHYIYLSSYRVFDDKEHPIRESSPRLLDTADDLVIRNSEDYAVYKARGENILRALPRKNWTIVRPAITYSLLRYQLVTLEAHNTVGRARAGKKVVLPEQARAVQGTMSWGGDVARMIAGLLFNDKALCEDFNVATAEHHTWGEIADYYKDICGLDALWVDKEDYLRIMQPDPYVASARWQLECDRLFTRIMDNTKVLSVTGMKQSGLKPLYEGLRHEIGRCPPDHVWPEDVRMDAYLENLGLS